jgi:hypothetical protein
MTSGFGGGKTFGLLMKHLKLSKINKNVPGGIFVPTYTEFTRDVEPLMEQILIDNNIPIVYHQTKHTYRFPWTKAKTYIITCETRIRGPNLGFCSINEPGLITYQRYKEILGRRRLPNVPVAQVNMAGTPEGTSHWLYEHCVLKKLAKVIFGDTRANQKHLSETYIQELKDNYDSIMLQAYLEGKFVNMNGAMFYYAFTRSKNCDSQIKWNKEKHPTGPLICCMDFNVQRMTSTLWYDFGEGPRAFDEIMIRDNADTNKMCVALKARGYTPDITTVFPDTSGKNRSTSNAGHGDIKILESHGYTCRFKPKAPTFRERQLSVCNLMDKGQLKINDVTCPTLLRDCEGVEQDVASFEKIKDNPELTHASDGMDYMIDILYPLSGKKPSVTSYHRSM